MTFLKQIKRYLSQLLGAFIIFSGVSQASLLVNGGMEFYYFERKKAGGTHQENILEGGRLIIERMEPFGIYGGINAFWGGGKISGFNALGKKLVSEISDFIIDGRLGYTFISGPSYQSMFTVFGGYGYFHETNSFIEPSPMRYTSTDTFNYLLFGFLSGHNFNSMVSIGLNFEVKFMLNGESKISDDPPFDDLTLHMTNEIQARVEIPFSYRFFLFQSLLRYPCRGAWEAQVVPFYEYRHFGGREDFPFDFIDTQFNLVGVRLGLGICF